MSNPVIRIKVLPKPTIRGKMDVRFPAKVEVENFLTLTKQNGVYTFSVDYTKLSALEITDPTTAMVALLDQSAQIYKVISVADILSGAVKPEDLAEVAFTGNYNDLTNKPALGTAAFQNTSAFATAAQGTKADSALQPAAIGSSVQAFDADLSAIAALTGTNTIPYRSGANTWGGVTIGSGLTFSGGTLDAAGGGGGGLSNADRQNMMLDRIYQAKVYGGVRNGVNTQAIGFVASTDINSGSSSNYALNLSSGNIAPSSSTGSFSNAAATTLSNNVTGQGGQQFRIIVSSAVIANVSGNRIKISLTPPTTGNNTNISSCWIGHQGGSAPNFDGNQVRVTFSGGNSATVLTAGGSAVVSDAVAFAFDHTKTLIVAFETTGTSDARTGTSTGFSFYNKAGAGESGNTTVSGYSASAANSGAWLTSVDVATATPDNMTVVTPSQTVAATVTSGRLLIEYDNTATPTLNTDLLGYVSCDGGSNFTQVTFSAAGRGQSGRLVAESADTSITNTGTSICAKITTANNKNVPVYGAAILVH